MSMMSLCSKSAQRPGGSILTISSLILVPFGTERNRMAVEELVWNVSLCFSLVFLTSERRLGSLAIPNALRLDELNKFYSASAYREERQLPIQIIYKD